MDFPSVQNFKQQTYSVPSSVPAHIPAHVPAQIPASAHVSQETQKIQKAKASSQRYPTQYDESSVKTDITEADIAQFVKRAAMNACQNKIQCDETEVVEDCPRNECYKNYLDPNYNTETQKMEPSKKTFFDNLKNLISNPSNVAYHDEPESYVVSRNRLDDLLQNRVPPCDVNKVEDLPIDDKPSGACSLANPNQCDRVAPNVDCGNRECYKKYLMDDFEEKKSGMVRSKFEEDNFQPKRANYSNGASTNISESRVAYQKKYNTLVVNSDVVVPDFIDVLVVVSENPIKITLPSLTGPSLASSVGKITSASNLLIKNLSLCSHQIHASGNNKIDTVRASVGIEPAGKKVLASVHDSWILL
jgi:hypothetical protein